MIYFRWRRAEKVFTEYRALAVAYWEAVEPTGVTWMAGPGAALFRDTEASRPIRQQLALLFPEAENHAQRLGVSVGGVAYAPAAVGGPALPFNLLAHVTDLWLGYSYTTKQDVLDAIDRAIGAARTAKKRALFRMVLPWNWLIDVPALIVGWPFSVMRRAGVPEKFIDGTAAQIAKAVMTGVMWIAGVAWAALKAW